MEQLLNFEPREIDIAQNQRFALVGKTRSGKTSHAMGLASTLVPYDNKDWEAWWIDTKNDPDDWAALNEWGFMVPRTTKHNLFGLWRPDKPRARQLHIIQGKNIPDQAEEIIGKAYNKGGVVVIVDEYVQVVKNSQLAGEQLLNVFQRGGGKDVGLIGLTQEPVYVPRQLLSQATHQFLYNLSFPRDIQYVQDLYPDYVRPTKLPIERPEEWGHTKRMDHKHGFYHVAVDYDGEGQYFRNQYQWWKTINRNSEKG